MMRGILSTPIKESKNTVLVRSPWTDHDEYFKGFSVRIRIRQRIPILKRFMAIVFARGQYKNPSGCARTNLKTIVQRVRFSRRTHRVYITSNREGCRRPNCTISLSRFGVNESGTADRQHKMLPEREREASFTLR